MDKKIAFITGLFLLTAMSAWASPPERAAGWCEEGNQVVVINGSSSTTKVQRSYPQCTVTVYFHGTTTVAPIFSDNIGTPMANPFVASTAGYWFFYANDSLYDVQLSGSSFSTPYTIGAVRLFSYLTPGDFNAVCDGTTDDTAALQALVAGANGGTVHFTQPCVLNANLTFPSTLALQFDSGGQIIVGSGKTLTINSSISAAPIRIFAGAGTAVVSNPQVQLMPQWWGAVGDGITNSTFGIQAALNSTCSTGGTMFIPSGVYNITSTITTPVQCNGIVMQGAGGYVEGTVPSKGAVITWTGAVNGTMMNIHSSSWGHYRNFALNGNHTAGIGLWVQADNPTGSSQKNELAGLMIDNVQGSPGRALSFDTLNNDDDSQNDVHDCWFSSNVVSVYQNGNQTIGQTFRHNTSYLASQYDFEFENGDVYVEDNLFIVDPAAAPGSLTLLAHVYIGPLTHKVFLLNNEYECLGGLDPSKFSNYVFASGAAPNDVFPVYLIGERVEWTMVGGKVMDYEHAGALTIESITADDISGTTYPGMWYISNPSVGTIQVSVIGSYMQSPSYTFALGNKVSLRSGNSSVNVQDGVSDGGDASFTTGSSTLTVSGTHNIFTSGMVGDSCYVQNFGSNSFAFQTIIAYVSPTQVTLGENAATSGSSKYYRCGRSINVGAGILATSTPNTVDNSTIVSDGGNPRFWMRRTTGTGGANTTNWALRADATGGHIAVLNGDNPASATPSDFFTLTPDSTGKVASSTNFLTPIRIGSITNPLLTIYYHDISVPFSATIAAGAFSGQTVVMSGPTLTAGADECEAWGNISQAGVFTSCFVQASNNVIVTMYNETTNPVTVGTVTMRIKVTKFSYTGVP